MLRAGLDLVHLSLCAVRFSRISKDSLTPASPVSAHTPSRNGAYCLSPWVIPVWTELAFCLLEFSFLVAIKYSSAPPPQQTVALHKAEESGQEPYGLCSLVSSPLGPQLFLKRHGLGLCITVPFSENYPTFKCASHEVPRGECFDPSVAQPAQRWGQGYLFCLINEA